MIKMNPKMQVLRITSNELGNDYVMGDLHGEYRQLQRLLVETGFNPISDRLFSVGDLIDRGEDSIAALALLEQPWFYAVRGNHEHMLIEAAASNNLSTWRRQWGDWAANFSEVELESIAARLDLLPCVIVVGENTKRFHIVHAALAYPSQIVMKNQNVDELDDHSIESCLPLLVSRWMAFRHRMFAGKDQEILDAEAIDPKLSLTFCGHTPLPRAGWLWSHYMIDQGAGYSPRHDLVEPKLSIYCVNVILAEFNSLKLSRQKNTNS